MYLNPHPELATGVADPLRLKLVLAEYPHVVAGLDLTGLDPVTTHRASKKRNEHHDARVVMLACDERNCARAGIRGSYAKTRFAL